MVLSVSRLAYWKRVDRSIQVISTIVKKHPETSLRLLILGDGADKERLIALTKELGIEEYIIFGGAVSNKEIGAYYKLADFFISTYDLSNVGNPLLEAIRFNKIIFTLNNGDTSRWIKHKKNGFIYDIDETFIERMAEDLYKSSNEKQFIESIQSEIIRTEKEMLWTWDERLRAELNLANTLVGK
jgi:glycosyltransferase involved in cell wall biosynthesis